MARHYKGYVHPETQFVDVKMKKAYQLVMVRVTDDDLDGGVYDWIKKHLWGLRKHLLVDGYDKDYIYGGFRIKLWVPLGYLSMFEKLLSMDV